DVDTGLVWPDRVGESEQEDHLQRVEALLTDLESCGFPRCPNGANAVNPLFARTSQAWASRGTSWLQDPQMPQALLLSSMVIDSRPVTEVTLGRTVTDALRRRDRSTGFLSLYVKEATAVRPPSGFVRDFVVDHRGDQRGKLNLKRGGLVPIA